MLAMHEAMLAYEATPGAADGSVGQFVARSEHPLVLSGTAKESADKLVEMPDAGDGKVAWMTMGEIVVKHVEIDGVLGGYAAFELFFKDKAWNKSYRCLVSLRGAGATRAVFSLATNELDASVRAATYEQRAGLRLGIDDVMPVEADAVEGVPADNGANQAARDEAGKYNKEIADDSCV